MWSRGSLRRVEAEKNLLQIKWRTFSGPALHTQTHRQTDTHTHTHIPLGNLKSYLTGHSIPRLGRCDVFRALNILTQCF